MKIGSLEAPCSVRVTVREGMRKSGRVCHVGGLGGLWLSGVRAPATISPSTPLKLSPSTPTPAERSNWRRVIVWFICTQESASPERDPEESLKPASYTLGMGSTHIDGA